MEETQPHSWLGADTTLTSLQSRAEKSCGSQDYSVCKAHGRHPGDALDPPQPPMEQITCGVQSRSPQHSHGMQASNCRTGKTPGTGPTLQEGGWPPR